MLFYALLCCFVGRDVIVRPKASRTRRMISAPALAVSDAMSERVLPAFEPLTH
jgi:hypothetical protein